jgi:uncharacterized membrane protein SpoIIM required for sporulation
VKLRRHIITASTIFLISIAAGYFFINPHDFLNFLRQVSKSTQFIIDSPDYLQAIYIFLNNLKVALINIVLGYLSLFIISINGIFIGGIFTVAPSAQSIFISTAAHGVFEIPAFILSAALGSKLNQSFFQFLKKQPRKRIFFNPIRLVRGLRNDDEYKTSFIYCFNLFIQYLIPMLILAAFLEVFVSAKIMEIYFPHMMR